MAQPAVQTVTVPPDHNDPKHKKHSRDMGFKHMFAGSFAGVCSKTILQPLDLVKTRLQVQDGKSRNEYRGVIHAVQTILKQEGPTGLYRGLTPNLMGSGVSWGVYFFTYNTCKDAWKRSIIMEQNRFSSTPNTSLASHQMLHIKLHPFQNLVCAAVAGIASVTVTNPISMVKTRMQLQGRDVRSQERLYANVFDAFTRIVREEGFLTLYRGLGPALVLVSNGALQFMAYEEFKKLVYTHLLPANDKTFHSYHYLGMGALAKMFSATVTYPMSVTRARLYQQKPDEMITQPQLATSQGTVRVNNSKYNGMVDVIRYISMNEGWRGFYRGLVPQLLKTAPASAITFTIYETVINIINTAEEKTRQQAAS